MKNFKSKNHLFSIFFCSRVTCNPLPKVTGGIQELSGKRRSLKTKSYSKKNTLPNALYKLRWQLEFVFK